MVAVLVVAVTLAAGPESPRDAAPVRKAVGGANYFPGTTRRATRSSRSGRRQSGLGLARSLAPGPTDPGRVLPRWCRSRRAGARWRLVLLALIVFLGVLFVLWRQYRPEGQSWLSVAHGPGRWRGSRACRRGSTRRSTTRGTRPCAVAAGGTRPRGGLPLHPPARDPRPAPPGPPRPRPDRAAAGAGESTTRSSAAGSRRRSGSSSRSTTATAGPPRRRSSPSGPRPRRSSGGSPRGWCREADRRAYPQAPGPRPADAGRFGLPLRGGHHVLRPDAGREPQRHGALAELIRGEGHTVRSAVRLSDELNDWADVIVRFAPYPGPIARQGRLVTQWRATGTTGGCSTSCATTRPRPSTGPRCSTGSRRTRRPTSPTAPQASRRGPALARQAPPAAKTGATAEEWFAVESPASPSVRVCKGLGGPWAAGIDPQAAALPAERDAQGRVRDRLAQGGRPAAGDRLEPLREQPGRRGGRRLLPPQRPLLNPARRPLAKRAADWLGGAGPGRHVAFVEGRTVVGAGTEGRSIFALLEVPPFGWVLAQMLVLGLAACLAIAPRLGRPRGEPPAGEDRPAAHPEALGVLLARTGEAEQAPLLETYRKWRKG